MATTTALHPRLSLNAICSMNQGFDDDLVLWDRLGVEHVGLIAPKLVDVGWDHCLGAIKDRGLRISSMSTYWDDIEPSIEFTAAVGSKVLYMVSGSGGSSLWEEAADRYLEQIAPWVVRAREVGVTLALEPTNPLRTDVSFVHTVRDAAFLARQAGLGIVVDVYSSWYERDLVETVATNLDLIVLSQIGDFKLGTFDIPNRCAIGEGDIPVERLMTMMLDAGYEGAFDLEILGPPLEEEGYFAPIARSLERASEMLARLDPVS